MQLVRVFREVVELAAAGPEHELVSLRAAVDAALRSVVGDVLAERRLAAAFAGLELRAEAVGGHVLGNPEACVVQHRRGEVEHLREAIEPRRRDPSPRRDHEHGHSRNGLVEVALAVEPEVAAHLAMVRGEENQRVLPLPALVEGRDDAPHLVVNQVHQRMVVGRPLPRAGHGLGRACFRRPAAVWEAVAEVDVPVGGLGHVVGVVAVEVLGRHVERPMGPAEPAPGEPGLRGWALDEVHGVVADPCVDMVLRREREGEGGARGLVLGRAAHLVDALVAAGHALLEPLGVLRPERAGAYGQAGALRPTRALPAGDLHGIEAAVGHHVDLAEARRVVARRAQPLVDGQLMLRQPGRGVDDRLHVGHGVLVRVAAGLQAGPRGDADGVLDVAPAKQRSPRGEGVDVRCATYAWADTGERVEALLVGGDKQDVGPGHGSPSH